MADYAVLVNKLSTSHLSLSALTPRNTLILLLTLHTVKVVLDVLPADVLLNVLLPVVPKKMKMCKLE
jgi:hypothetical protein